MAKNTDAKRLRILEAAKKRFAHYGLAKTTMAEIAQDLTFSKALLYYYFPDKNSLYAAVLEMANEEVVQECAAIIRDAADVMTAIENFLDVRLRIIKDNYNIFEFPFSLRNDMPVDLENIMPVLFEKQIQQIRAILEKGIATGELKPIDDLDLTAKLLQISLLGMRVGVLKEYKNIFFPPSKEEFDYILTLQKKLAKIFIDGLRK